LEIPPVNKFDRCLIDVLINGIDELNKMLPWLTLLSNMSQYYELWSYVGEMEWFSDEGLKRFYEEYSNVTNVLLGGSGSYEMSLLDSMEPVVRLFSAIGKFKESHTISALFENFENSVDIFATVNDTSISNHIHQVHDRLSEIKDWFSNGVNEIGAAYLQFAAAQRSGTYFMSQDNGNYVLSLRFTVENNDESLLSGNSLEQFILQLNLIQNENEATASGMQIFIDQFQILTIAYRKFLFMEKFGFITISTSDFDCCAGCKYMKDAKYLLNVSEEQMEGFNAWLSRTRMNYKISLLYWTEELRQLYESVCSPDADDIVLMDFTFRLRPLWSNMLDIEGVRRFHQICLMASVDRRVSNQRFSWLEEVSHLIEDIHLGLIEKDVCHCSMQRSEIVLHSVCCDDDDIQLATLRILQQVYKVSFPKMRFYISCFKLTFVYKKFQDRIPHSFEIIDGSVLHTQERLCLFLDRVKGFPSLRFTVISAERLSSYNLEMLVLFLSNREIGSFGICLHCVQRGDSLIHTAPWIEGRSWDAASFADLKPYWSKVLKEKIDVTVVTSSHCGTGKTTLVREQQNVLHETVPNSLSASIVIHEKSSIFSLVRTLRRKFCIAHGRCVFHISFSFLPLHGIEHEQWLREIKHFFFSVITLRTVHDPIAGTSFSFTGELILFIELPGTAGEGADSWLKRNIPIISLCAKFCKPRNSFVLDHEARRVCTYLRAYENGTINRRYQNTAKSALCSF
jgi:hypothetical protein